MKKLILALLFLLLSCSISFAENQQLAWIGPVIAGSSNSSPESYCSGTELFCSTFESPSSWSATNGTSDCDGYDADGDYCDGDTSTYAIGAKSLGLRGSSSTYVNANLSSLDVGEFYLESWVRFDDAVSNLGWVVRTTTSTDIIKLAVDAGGSITVATKDGVTVLDTNYTVSADTWYHIGVYLKVETAAENNDGVIRVWINTSTTAGFSSGDYQSDASSTSVDTGTALADVIWFRGEATNEVIYYDNVKVISGEPSWAY
jgi:hypothetical protein